MTKKLWGNLLLMAMIAAAGCTAPSAMRQSKVPVEQGVFAPKAVLEVMERVADWQLAHAYTNGPAPGAIGWVPAAGYTGFMALDPIAGTNKYRKAMYEVGAVHDWKPARRPYHADDQCIGQTYAELYTRYGETNMIQPIRERCDFILANPAPAEGLDIKQPSGHGLDVWSWCDALFMAPPTWIRLYNITGDERYLNFAVSNWWRTTEFLYDKEEHLYFRDSTFFQKREANGKKVFWSRGNGWVIAGLARFIPYLPANHPDRPKFEKLFKEMAEKIRACQQPDGLWHASLLDPASFPLKEASGSGFYVFALAWGVNERYLDRKKFEPVIRKGWTALTECVQADGKLTHVQPVGSNPVKFADDSTAPYGVGAFLLAGSEIYRMVKW